MTNRFFSYDPDGDYFSTHATAAAARAKAQSALDHEGELALENGEWGERVHEICWGVMWQVATNVTPDAATAEYRLE